MKLSVILPCYNIDDEYFQIGLDSLLNQTFSDFELIIVDDCSPNPNNVKYIRSLQEQDPRIKLIQNNPNQGAAESRNIGLREAQGEYIAFFDGDDYVDNKYYERLVTAAEKTNADIVMCGFVRVDNNGKVLKTRDINDSECSAKEDSIRAMQFKKLSYSPCNKLYRYEIVKDIRFPKGVKLAEDVEFNFQAFLKARKSISVSNNCYFYRYNPSSVTSKEQDGAEAIRTNILVTEKLTEIYDTFPIGAKLKKEIEKYLLFRFVRYANKFGRLKDADTAEKLWQDYKALYQGSFAKMRQVMPFRYKLLSTVFGAKCSLANMKVKIALLRLLLSV